IPAAGPVSAKPLNLMQFVQPDSAGGASAGQQRKAAHRESRQSTRPSARPTEARRAEPRRTKPGQAAATTGSRPVDHPPLPVASPRPHGHDSGTEPAAAMVRNGKVNAIDLTSGDPAAGGARGALRQTLAGPPSAAWSQGARPQEGSSSAPAEAQRSHPDVRLVEAGQFNEIDRQAAASQTATSQAAAPRNDRDRQAQSQSSQSWGAWMW